MNTDFVVLANRIRQTISDLEQVIARVERAIRDILISLARVGEISTMDGGHSFARRLTGTRSFTCAQAGRPVKPSPRARPEKWRRFIMGTFFAS